MSTRTDSLDQLTEEVFGHLCNIAISKCNDRMEKRKAGCGGKAMRKRVLIKNFVSDLMRSHNEKYTDEEISDCDEEYEEDDSSSNTTMCHTDDSEAELTMDLDDSDTPQSDCWLSGEAPMTYLSDYIHDPVFSTREGAVGRADNKPLSPPESRLGLYDFLSPSESAAEGGQPEAVSPLDPYMHTVPAHSLVEGFQYDLGMSARYDLSLTSFTPLSEVGDASPLQPVRAEASDQIYLSLTSNSYSEMKTYTPLTDALPESVVGHELTDLDAPELISLTPMTPKKRKSDEMVLYLDEQKRLKL